MTVQLLLGHDEHHDCSVVLEIGLSQNYGSSQLWNPPHLCSLLVSWVRVGSSSLLLLMLLHRLKQHLLLNYSCV
jgi:hypothetical protein